MKLTANRKKYLLLSLALVLVLVGGFVGWKYWKTVGLAPSPPVESVTLGLSWIHEAQFAGEYFADQNGLYRQHGLEVKLIPYDNSDLVEKLVSGEYQFAILQGEALLQARSEGKPLVGLYVTYRVSPTVFFAKGDSGIKSPADFAGKKVGVAYSEKTPLEAMLKYAGVDQSKVTIIDREYSYEPLLRGDYDVEAGWVTDADTVKKLLPGPPTVIRATDYNANIFADVIVTTEDLIKNRPDLVRNFTVATRQGWEAALRDADGSALLTQRYDAAADPVHLKMVMNASQPYIQPSAGSPLGESSFAEWVRMYLILKGQGLIAKDFGVSGAYTTDFLQ